MSKTETFTHLLASLPPNVIGIEKRRIALRAFAQYTSGPLSTHQINCIYSLSPRAARILLSSFDNDNYEPIAKLLRNKLKLTHARRTRNRLGLTVSSKSTTTYGRRSAQNKNRLQSIQASTSIADLFNIDHPAREEN